MNKYQKILLAVNFHADNDKVVDTASTLADLYKAELHVVHVNESIGLAYTPDGVSWGEQVYALRDSIHEESKKQLDELGQRLKLPSERLHLLEGRPATKIHELCETLSISLVVLGTHGQSGLQLLLGSTANGVLHGSECDVLAVRV